MDLEKYLKKGSLNKNRKECVRNEKNKFYRCVLVIAFIVFVLNCASLWQDIAYWIVPSKDLYMDKPEIIRDLIKVVPMIILGIVVFVIGIRQGLKNYYGDYSGDTKQQ